MKIFYKSLFYLFFICTFFLSNAYSSFIQIVGKGNFSNKNFRSHILLEGEYSMTNNGDSEAQDVFFKISLGGYSYAGDSVNLKPKESHTWKIKLKIDKSFLICKNDPSCSDLKLPSLGAFPLKVTKFYKDMANYQFSAPEIFRLIIGKVDNINLSSLKAPEVNAKVTVKGDGQEFVLDILVLSKVKDIKYYVSFFTSQELKVSRDIFLFNPDTSKNSSLNTVKISNFSGLSNSKYPVYSIIQWEENGLRNFIVRAQSISIESPSNLDFYIILSVIGVLIVLVIFFIPILKGKD